MSPSLAHDKPLFTPGPLTTSTTVKQAMLRDLGSRDDAFIAVVRSIRDRLLQIAETDPARYAAIPLQGSGTYALEAVVTTLIPEGDRMLVLVNGAYGRRFATLARRLGIDVGVMEWPENRPVDPVALKTRLKADPSIRHVSVCHCETSSGVMNPVREIGRIVHQYERRLIVDAMSSFGAISLNMERDHVDVMVSSANKCIEGVPGFSFVLTRLDDLLASEGRSRSTCLDLYAQYHGLEADGQFRFTPPTHSILAFHQALRELEEEGGVEGRGTRYWQNHDVLICEMEKLGFTEYVPREFQGPIITTYHYPDHERFSFNDFYSRLNDMGYVIYPGKVTDAACFRIGSIGRIFPRDMIALTTAIERVVADMGFVLTPEGTNHA